jgi:hypothetical protein
MILLKSFLGLQGKRRCLVCDTVVGAMADIALLEAKKHQGKQRNGERLEKNETEEHLPSYGARPPAHLPTSEKGALASV